ncbi:MAG: carboxylating nicotinate-nucleotide diphosphorylase [Moraxella sp.]|jgi:nicotinate-nucleotide pyrophosphorylase (carboxylating)|nr:carboxylating nicotinate-nucleotide diphosphorylase [Moraxella osloensis]MBP6341458.1 carboxylating nicotinate-nucleotide diphosphorylase [Moraxella sp.]MBP7234182.1 carboxylating nicotinate-nucleotide diphosphorylase [Moraxella sp.]
MSAASQTISDTSATTPQISSLLRIEIAKQVALALQEDIATGDINAQLIPDTQCDTATIICREPMVVAGKAWVDEVFRQLDPNMQLDWAVKDGDAVAANQILVTLIGNTRALLTGERTALNFLQTLSSTATVVANHVAVIAELPTKLLDTRKTIPMLRHAQKYAMLCGGGNNHRIGLYDAFLIKENHIMACGGIAQAVSQARQIANKPVEVEVENFDELQQAIAANADIVMLDNFTIEDTQKAVELVASLGKPCQLEASGDISLTHLRQVAETGVDFISMGALTKHIKAIDLSMRFQQ